ncbi:DJ-1/PfpI family protein, partial [Streptomyces sp. NPDC004050]
MAVFPDVDLRPDGPVARIDPDVVAWINTAAPPARRVASVCVGAHLLAAAGLLDGRTATTHWSTAAQLAADHPAVRVGPDPIFVGCGNVSPAGRLLTGCRPLFVRDRVLAAR